MGRSSRSGNLSPPLASMRLPSPSETAAQGKGSGGSFPYRQGNSKADAYGAATANGTTSTNKIFEAPYIPTNNFREKVCTFREKVCTFREKVCTFREKVCTVKKYNALYIREINPLLQLFQNVIPKSYSKQNLKFYFRLRRKEPHFVVRLFLL